MSKFQKGHKINNGKKHTEEHNNKIGNTLRGKPLSEEHKQKLRKPHKIFTKRKPHSEETKKKISDSLIGIKFSEERKRKTGLAHKGLKHTEEHKKKIGLALRGEKCHFWKGDKMKDYPENEKIRKSLEYKLWRKTIYLRDDFTCQKYGIKGGRLVAHHINNFADFPELRLDISNGITLSKKAHEEFHKKYGFNNNTKGQLEEFLSQIQ